MLLGLCGAVLLLFFCCIWLWLRLHEQKKRFDFFMGTGRRPAHNLEMKLEKFYESSKNIEENYSKLLDMVTDMDKVSKSKIQKVGLIRYNPFDEMGGNLCFALALLDGNDNGVVLNGIHSRTGSFTYAKPIEMGVSTYMLSDEEVQAVEMAKEKAYQPEHEKVLKVRFHPIFRRKDKENTKQREEKPKEEKTEAEQSKEKISSLGDVTQAEKALIFQEETLAGQIAAAEAILKKHEKALERRKAPQEITQNTVENAVEEVENREKAENSTEIPPVLSEAAIFEPVFLEQQADMEIEKDAVDMWKK